MVLGFFYEVSPGNRHKSVRDLLVWTFRNHIGLRFAWLGLAGLGLAWAIGITSDQVSQTLWTILFMLSIISVIVEALTSGSITPAQLGVSTRSSGWQNAIRIGMAVCISIFPIVFFGVNYPALKGAASCFIEPAPEGLT